ncbi:hypothetical protein KCU77_g902, partial [Aureobasidium melanogenum]
MCPAIKRITCVKWVPGDSEDSRNGYHLSSCSSLVQESCNRLESGWFGVRIRLSLNTFTVGFNYAIHQCAESTIKDARIPLGLIDGDNKLRPAIDTLESNAQKVKSELEEKETEVNESRALLVLSEDVTLQDGIKNLQGERNSATSEVANVRQTLGLTDATANTITAIQKVKSDAQQNKDERQAREKEINDAKSLLNLSGTTSLQDGLVELKNASESAEGIIRDARSTLQLTDPNIGLVNTIDGLKSEAQANKTSREASEKEVRDAKSLLSISDKTSLHDGLVALHDASESAKGIIKNARSSLELTDPNLNLVDAINQVKSDAQTRSSELETVRGQLTTALSIIEHAQKDLELQDKDSPISPAIKSLKEQLQQAQDTLEKSQREVNDARGLLKLSTSTTLQKGLRDLQEHLRNAEATVKAAQETLSLSDADSNISRAIINVQDQLKNANGQLDDARKSLDLSDDNADISQAIGRLQSNSKILNDDLDVHNRQLGNCIHTIRSLLVPANDLNSLPGMTIVDLQTRYRPLGAKVDDKSTPLTLEKLNWSLEIGNIPTTKEPFNQLTERLRAMMVFGAEVPDRLDVLEALINQVDQCTLADLNALFRVLCNSWISSGHAQMVELNFTPILDGAPQSSLQVLFEARLLELLIRGSSVLRYGWSNLATAVEDSWRVINETVINENLILRAYDAWFKSLDRAGLEGITYHLMGVVEESDASLICSDRTDSSRLLIASVVVDGSYCYLCKTGEPRATMYAVSDLQYHLPRSVIVFPTRDRGNGVVSADPPFSEPPTQTFAENHLQSLYSRGSTAVYRGQ